LFAGDLCLFGSFAQFLGGLSNILTELFLVSFLCGVSGFGGFVVGNVLSGFREVGELVVAVQGLELLAGILDRLF